MKPELLRDVEEVLKSESVKAVLQGIRFRLTLIALILFLVATDVCRIAVAGKP